VSNLDRLMPEDVKGYDYERDDYRANQADIDNDERAADAFDNQLLTVTLKRAEMSHVLSLLLQFGIAERRNTVSRQLNQSAMTKIDGALS